MRQNQGFITGYLGYRAVKDKLLCYVLWDGEGYTAARRWCTCMQVVNMDFCNVISTVHKFSFQQTFHFPNNSFSKIAHISQKYRISILVSSERFQFTDLNCALKDAFGRVSPPTEFRR